MPWKQGYTISDEISPKDEAIHWPGGAQCCVSITIDLTVASGPAGITAADLQASPAVFGAHEGLALVRAALNRFGLKATVALPAVLATIRADGVRALIDDGHEIAGNGYRHEDVSQLSREDEKARIDRSTEILTKLTGKPPAGWYSLPRQNDPYAGGSISPNTMDLLIDAGYRYFGNGLADDVPHWWVTDFARRRALLTMPYYYHFDDQWFLMFPTKGTGLEHADGLFRNWRAEFNAQYRRGRHFHMVLHPMLIGWCNRMQRLETFFEYLAGFPGLWNPTAGECTEHWRTAYPPETHLKLEPSVWKDYPGSLS